jgi:hypothetical protein
MMQAQDDLNFDSYFAGKALTTNWGVDHYDRWAAILAPLRAQALRILEIGAWEGRSALFFLNYLPRSSITCVDTFAGSVEHRAWPLWRRIRQLRGVEGRFDQNLMPFADRVEKRKEDSLVALGKLGMEERRFDLVYIDGSHLALDVYRDGVLAWPLVAPGGIVIFDDYARRQGPAPDWPGIGIDAFVRTLDGNYDELHRGRQLIIRRH